MENVLLKNLMATFKVSEEAFEKHMEYYNNHFNEYGNEIYEDIKTRLVHLSNFSETNWFNKRYDMLFRHYSTFDCIIEVGFSLPYLPLKENKPLPKLIYVDTYQSALEISKEIMKGYGQDARFIKGDIEEEATWSSIREEVKGRTLLVAIEILEHLENPDYFWKEVKNLNPSGIVISFPIGPKIPSHHSYFEGEDEVREYFERYLVIEEEHIIEPENKSGRDLDKYKDLIVFGRLKGDVG